AGLPTPRTWIFFNRQDAVKFIEKTSFPLVLKLPKGRGSDGVVLIKDRNEANIYVETLFNGGISALWKLKGSAMHIRYRRWRDALAHARGENIWKNCQGGEVIFQEFLPNNQFDIRVTVIGRYATALKRWNRPGDFRASGSGLIDYGIENMDERVIELAFRTSRTLDAPFIAIDFLFSDGDPVICEINFAYRASVVRKCPGCWVVRRDNADEINNFSWNKRPIDPELTTLREFLHHYQIHNAYEGNHS
ncbi:ATP-grasp domain-containing protein, partial [Ectothiorhodospira variabilis]|uniref:ATP-grasp domain-containing protein n=1 Tax=Ectothiorhodospira variabilis TaxID=505694 RepID=UPI001EFB3868